MSVWLCFSAVDSCLVSSARQPHMNQDKIHLGEKLGEVLRNAENSASAVLLLSFKLTDILEIVIEL